MENFGLKIQDLRKRESLSQEELSNLLGVSRQTVSKWERSEVLPDLYNARKIANVFGISVDELMDMEIQIVTSEEGKNSKIAISFLLVTMVFTLVLSVLMTVAPTILLAREGALGITIMVSVIAHSISLSYAYSIYQLYLGKRKRQSKTTLVVLNFLLLSVFILSLPVSFSGNVGYVIFLVVSFAVIVLGLIGSFKLDINKRLDFTLRTVKQKKFINYSIRIYLGLLATFLLVTIGFGTLTHEIDVPINIFYELELNQDSTNNEGILEFNDSGDSKFSLRDGTVAADDVTSLEIYFDNEIIFQSDDDLDVSIVNEVLVFSFDCDFNNVKGFDDEVDISIVININNISNEYEQVGVEGTINTTNIIVPIWKND